MADTDPTLRQAAEYQLDRCKAWREQLRIAAGVEDAEEAVVMRNVAVELDSLVDMLDAALTRSDPAISNTLSPILQDARNWLMTLRQICEWRRDDPDKTLPEWWLEARAAAEIKALIDKIDGFVYA